MSQPFLSALLKFAITSPVWLYSIATIPAAAQQIASQMDAPAVMTVKTAKATKRPIQTTTIATGTVTAWRELLIGSETGGLSVVKVVPEEGETVGKGDLLVQLNDTILRAQIAQQNAAITEARANMKTAEADLKRARKLIGNKTISEQTLDERANTVETNKAKLAAAEASLKALEAQLEQARILAPAAGLISSRSVNIGQVVSVGTELLRIVQDGRLEVDALVPEDRLFAITPGQTARVTGPSGMQIDAQVRAIMPTVNEQTRLGTVHIALPSNTALKPGMFVRVEISSNSAMALTIPLESIVYRTGKPNVFVIGNDNIAAQTPVQMGRSAEGNIEITGGLEGGETVVAQGAGFLNDGDRVRIELQAAVNQEAER